MSEQKQPEPGEYWQHKRHTDDRAYFIGRTPEGEMVWQCEGDTIEAGNLDWSGWQHLPDCTGWDWKPPVKVPVRLWIKRDVIGMHMSVPVVARRDYAGDDMAEVLPDGYGGWYIEVKP